jgi:hypothetical protein
MLCGAAVLLCDVTFRDGRFNDCKTKVNVLLLTDLSTL